MKKLYPIAICGLLLSTASFVAGCASHDHDHHHDARSAGGAYPMTKCVVSGENLGNEPYTFTRNGQEVKLCCKDCLAEFNKDTQKYMAKINKAR